MTAAAPRRPLYARALRLRRLRPGPVLCFIFLWGAIALGVLLAVAKLASWWAVLALPVAVAVMVKLNDVVAGATARKPPPPRKTAPKQEPEREPEQAEKPDWPVQEKPAKSLIEEENDERDGQDKDQEEDTEKTESPAATRSSSE